MKTPKCPACGAKFSHDATAMQCKACGLPDEVVHAGPQAVARWKRKPLRREVSVSESGLVTVTTVQPTASKSQRKQLRMTPHHRKARIHRNKHGRVGVKRGG